MKKKMFIFSGIVLIIISIIFIVLALNINKSEKIINETQPISENQIENKVVEDSKIENIVEFTDNEDIQEKTTETIEESPKTETTKEEKVISQQTQKEEKQKTSEPVTTTQVAEKPQEVVQEVPKAQKETEPKATAKPKKEEPKQEPAKQETPKCSGNSHGVATGNSGRWFNSETEAINYYNSIINDLGKKWENFEIDDETYNKKCPYGYEDWSCPYCGKWTINFYYNK